MPVLARLFALKLSLSSSTTSAGRISRYWYYCRDSIISESCCKRTHCSSRCCRQASRCCRDCIISESCCRQASRYCRDCIISESCCRQASRCCRQSR